MLSEEMKKVLDFYNEGLSLYKNRQWQKAMEKFKKAADIKPDDGPSKLYIERCDHFMKNPPPEDWDGVFTMTTK